MEAASSGKGLYTKKSERSKRREWSGASAISRGSSLFSSFVWFLASRKVSSQEQETDLQASAVSIYAQWKVLWYVDFVENYWGIKVLFSWGLTNHWLKNACCDGGVSLTSLAVIRCSLMFLFLQTKISRQISLISYIEWSDFRSVRNKPVLQYSVPANCCIL